MASGLDAENGKGLSNPLEKALIAAGRAAISKTVANWSANDYVGSATASGQTAKKISRVSLT